MRISHVSPSASWVSEYKHLYLFSYLGTLGNPLMLGGFSYKMTSFKATQGFCFFLKFYFPSKWKLLESGVWVWVTLATAWVRGFPPLNEVITIQLFSIEPTLPGSFTKSLGRVLATYIALLPKGISCSSHLAPRTTFTLQRNSHAEAFCTSGVTELFC